MVHPHQQVKPPLAPPHMNLKRRRASVAVLLRSKPPVPIDMMWVPVVGDGKKERKEKDRG